MCLARTSVRVSSSRMVRRIPLEGRSGEKKYIEKKNIREDTENKRVNPGQQLAAHSHTHTHTCKPFRRVERILELTERFVSLSMIDLRRAAAVLDKLCIIIMSIRRAQRLRGWWTNHLNGCVAPYTTRMVDVNVTLAAEPGLYYYIGSWFLGPGFRIRTTVMFFFSLSILLL